LDRIVSEEELRSSDGQEERPAYIAHNGNVYDVSQSRRWRVGSHFRRHQAGNDLTASLAAAPHDTSVFERVPLVGKLADPEPEPVAEEPQSRLTALLDLYFDLHPHPVAVHFPVALGFVAAAFLVLYLITGAAPLETSAFYVLWAALAMTPLAMLSGAMSWWFNYGRSMDLRFAGKMSLSVILLILVLFAVLLRMNNPSALLERQPLGWVYLMAVLAGVPLVAGLGMIGAKLVFPSRK